MKTKKLLSLLLTLCMLLSVIPMMTFTASAAAIGDYIIYGDIEYMVLTLEGNTGTVAVSWYVGTPASVNQIIPKTFTYEDITYTVTKIDDYGFNGCGWLESVTIPDSVTSIGTFAFGSCKKLTNITIPDSVTRIGTCAFCGCSALKNITIPDSITVISDSMFNGCSALTGFTISNNVTSIGNYAFSGCESFTDITIPNTVTSVGNGAFNSCINLTQITIPDSVTSIGDYAFKNCSALVDIIISHSVAYIGYMAFDGTGYYNNSDNWDGSGVLYIGNFLIKADSSKISGNYKIKDGTVCICYCAFEACTGLSGISIPDSMMYINDCAFSSSNFTTIEIPGSVKNIGASAFSNSSLTTVNIGEGVVAIGNSAFDGCSYLTSVTIPGSVTTIGDYAFSTVSLENVTFKTDNVNTLTIQVNSFNDITLPTELKEKATVKIYGLNNNTEINGNVRNGQMLKPVLEGYTGSTELYYQFTTGSYLYDLTYATSNITNSTEYYDNSYIFKNEAYAAIDAYNNPETLTCNVYEPVLTEGKLSFNLIATKTYNNPICSLTNTEELQAEFSENNVMVMQIGDGATSLVEILGQAGFTHLFCEHVYFNSVTKAEGESVKVNGSDKYAAITPVTTGLSKITFTCYTDGCTYHGTAGTAENPVNGAIYIYVEEKPTITATTNSITVTDNTTSPAVSTYRIGLTNTGTVNGKATTFTGLNKSTEYDVIQELNLTIDQKEYIGYYHNYISTDTENLYDITCTACTNGSISTNKSAAGSGEAITVTATPDEGYLLEALTYNQIGYDTTDIMTKKSFTMPESDVIVSATFAKAYDKDIALTYTKPITIGDTAKDIADKLSGYDSDIMTAKVEIYDNELTKITSLDKTDNEYLIAIFLFMKDKTEYLFKTTHVYNSHNLNSAYYDGKISVDDYSIFMSEGGTHIKDEDEDTISTPYGKDAAWIDDGLLIIHSITFPEEVAGASYSASLTLDADIDLNFTMGSLGTDGKGTGFDDDLLTITVDGNTWINYTVTDGTLSGVLKAVEPKDIGTDLHIVITYDGVTVKDFNYSVSDYCNAVYNAQGYGADSDLGKLCTALLNYGKYAQDYATGNTDSTVNEGHEITFGSNYSFTGLKDEKVIPGNYAGKGSEAYLTLGSTIKLNFILKNCSEVLSTGYKENGEADKDNPQNFYVLNDKAEPEQIDPKRIKVTTDGDDTIVSIDLYASQLSTSYTLKLKGVDTSKFCITYGVYNYCSDAQDLSVEDGFTDTVKTLCKAIHNYSEAVQAYIASTESTK